MNKQGSAGSTPTNTVRHRVLAAKPDKVYRAFTTADATARWLPPNGFTCTVHQMDSKVGGTYRMSFTNFTTGKTHVFGGKYLDLVPDELIRYTDRFEDPNLLGEMITTVTLQPVSIGTEVNIVQEACLRPSRSRPVISAGSSSSITSPSPRSRTEPRSPTLAAVVARLRRPQQWQASRRPPRRSAGAPSCHASFELAAIVGRCLPGHPMKGGAERARAMESHIERNLGDRCAAACQQGLGALNPPARPVAIRRLPEGLLEGSQKMKWAQPHQIGEHVERNVLGKVLLDEIHDALLFPRGKPATWRRP